MGQVLGCQNHQPVEAPASPLEAILVKAVVQAKLIKGGGKKSSFNTLMLQVRTPNDAIGTSG